MKDGFLYVDARGFKVVYNLFAIFVLWITQWMRNGHWYFDAKCVTQPAKHITKIGYKVILSVICLSISVMACGMPVVKSPKPYPPIVTFPVPSRSVTESPAPSERVACGSLWVRSGAGVEFERVGIALTGNRLQLTGREKEAKDGGLWLQVVDRDGYSGWVNARYLCEEE